MIIGIPVRMILQRLLAIGALDLLFGRLPRYFEDFVIVSLTHALFLRVDRDPHHSGPEEAVVSFGAAVRSVSAELARERGLPWRHGVEVGRVADGSPAAEAGVRPSDLITAIGAYTLAGGADQFRQAVAARRPGESMTITLWREGESLTTTVTFPVPARG